MAHAFYLQKSRYTLLKLDSLEFCCSNLVEHRPASGTFLFNQPGHLLLQSKKGWKVYEMMDKKTKKVLAQIFIHVKEKNGNSPLRAPFGSLEIHGSVDQKKVTEFLAWVESELRSQGVKYIRIKNYPEEYDALGSSLLEKALTDLNFSRTREVSSIIAVDQKIFAKKIAVSQRQKLKKSEKLFEFNNVRLSDLKSIYHFISVCRQEKNQSLSMTLAQLQKAVKTFPRNFILFQVANESQLGAAAIVIKINEKILYTFYYAHDKKFNKISPVVFLISGIYRYAQQHKIAMIDLGTSMVNGEINKPLLQFKKSIGGQPSQKYIFEKMLS